jgi:hypothetical protein
MMKKKEYSWTPSQVFIMYHLLEGKILVIDHIKIPAYAVNGSQLIVLCKSGAQKVDKCIKKERRGKMSCGKKCLFKPREVM